MLSDSFCEGISDDWLWREKEFRALDVLRLRKNDDVVIKASILITYSHWEGHFKFCALSLLRFIDEGIRRRIFRWTEVNAEIRQRILFCSYRRASVAGQKQETFISYLNALNDNRFSRALEADAEIIMIDDNLNTLRAEAVCRNLGVEPDWFITKKIIIDERLLEHRNAIAHGSQRLRSGDVLDLKDPLLLEAFDEIRFLIRETRNRFENAILSKCFLINSTE